MGPLPFACSRTPSSVCPQANVIWSKISSFELILGSEDSLCQPLGSGPAAPTFRLLCRGLFGVAVKRNQVVAFQRDTWTHVFRHSRSASRKSWLGVGPRFGVKSRPLLGLEPFSFFLRSELESMSATGRENAKSFHNHGSVDTGSFQLFPCCLECSPFSAMVCLRRPKAAPLGPHLNRGFVGRHKYRLGMDVRCAYYF